jgi:hypothetical protein
MESRIIIKAKDVQNLYGCTEKTARIKINDAKEDLKKEPKQPLTIKEFAQHQGLKEEEIRNYLHIK